MARPTPLPAGAVPPEAASAPPSARWGKYVRVLKIGFGGMGEVYKAWDLELTRWVALKVLVGRDDEDLARFRREAQLAARISHPNIAAIHEISNHDGHPYIAMQFIEGSTLRALAKADRRPLVRAIRDAAQALHVAHAHGTVHRDLKPENLMVQEVPGPRGTPEWHCFIMDFGLARTAGAASTISHAGDILGTPHYMPPEQARGEKVDGRADIYALGATLYDLLTGRRVFEDQTFMGMISKILEEPPTPPRRLDPSIDEDLQAIVLRCLEKAPAMRYPDAGSLAADLDRWLAGEPVEARPRSAPDRLRRWSGRHVTALAGFAALLVVATGTFLFVSGRETEARRRRDEADALRRDRETAESRARRHLELARRALEKMRLLMREQDYGAAALRSLRDSVFEESRLAAEAAPFLPEAPYLDGQARMLTGDEEGAVASFNRALKADPEFVPALLGRLRIRAEEFEHHRHGRVLDGTEKESARATLEADLAEVRRLAGTASEAAYAEGLLAFARADYATAEARVGSHLKGSPGDARGHAVRAHALAHLLRYDEALSEATKALEADTRLAVAWNQVGLCRRALGQPAAAVAAFDTAIRLNPRSWIYHSNRARARDDAGDQDGAISDFTEAAKRKPDEPEIYNGRGVVYIRMKRPDDALADFDRALKLNPQFTEALHNRGLTNYRKGRHAEAIPDFDAAVKSDPSYGLAWHYRGQAKASLKDHPGAIADFSECIRLGHDLADSHYYRGASYAAIDEKGRAAGDFRKALEIGGASWRHRSRCEAQLKKVTE